MRKNCVLVFANSAPQRFVRFIAGISFVRERKEVKEWITFVKFFHAEYQLYPTQKNTPPAIVA